MTTFCKKHSARLTQLADKLDSHVPLLVGSFDFSIVTNSCGTAGCALGEATLMWPKHIQPWGTGLLTDSASKFFGVTQREYNHLFEPCHQATKIYGGDTLSSDATRQQVAANIRAFLEYKAREQR